MTPYPKLLIINLLKPKIRHFTRVNNTDYNKIDAKLDKNVKLSAFLASAPYF
jgi:hypothetical protein